MSTTIDLPSPPSHGGPEPLLAIRVAPGGLDVRTTLDRHQLLRLLCGLVQRVADDLAREAAGRVVVPDGPIP